MLSFFEFDLDVGKGASRGDIKSVRLYSRNRLLSPREWRIMILQCLSCPIPGLLKRTIPCQMLTRLGKGLLLLGLNICLLSYIEFV